MKRLRLTALLALTMVSGCTKTKAPDPVAGECSALSSRVPMRLLTRAEYDNTIRDVLGDTSKPSRDFPREPLAEGFDNDGNLNQVTDESVTRYLEAAETIASATVKTRPERLYRCETQNSECMARFISSVGRRLFRRPLTEAETLAFSTLFATVQNGNDFDTATEWVLQVMLQSPQFLYRFEEGTDPAAGAWRTPLDDSELTTRLSYFLWASTPDDALLDEAASGALSDPEALATIAARMLADPKAAQGKARFFNLYLRLDDISGLEKSTGAYPAFTAGLPGAWRTSIDLFLNDVLTHDNSLPSLLTSNAMFVNGTMSMYGPGSTGSGTAFTKVMMPGGQRSGLLTQPGFLARLAGPDQSSPIRRGIFVLDRLLCQTPPPPPPTVNTTPPAVDLGGTTRERFAQHSQDASCKGCHSFIDPLGFGFEHYDGIGAWRDTDNNKPVDASGAIVLAREESLKGLFDGAAELMAKLSASRQVHDCVSKEWLRFAMGRGLGDGDDCSLTQVQDQFMNSGGNFDALLLAIVASDTFRTRPVETAP